MRVPRADTVLGGVLIQGEDRCQIAGVKRDRGRDTQDGRKGCKRQISTGPQRVGRLVDVAKAATL